MSTDRQKRKPAILADEEENKHLRHIAPNFEPNERLTFVKWRQVYFNVFDGKE